MGRNESVLAPAVKTPTKIWNPQFTSIFITNALLYLGQWICNTLVTKYADHLGATATIVGFVSSSFTITCLIFKLISAPAIDTYNRKHILCIALCVMGLSFAGYSISLTVPSLVAFRLVQGTGQAFTATCCLALATDALPKEKLGQGIGTFTLAQAICQAIGPTIGLNLVKYFSYNVAFAVAAVCMFAAAYMATRIKLDFKQTKKLKFSLDSVIAKEATIACVLLLLMNAAFHNISAFLVIFGGTINIDSAKISYFFTVYALTLLVTRPAIGKLTDRLGYVKVLLPAFVLFATAFLLISYATNLWILLLAAFISAFGYGACNPAVQALCMRMVSKNRRGAASCTSYIGIDAGNFLGPLYAGLMIDSFGYAAMWRFLLIPIILCMAIVLVFRKKIDHAGENVN